MAPLTCGFKKGEADLNVWQDVLNLIDVIVKTTHRTIKEPSDTTKNKFTKMLIEKFSATHTCLFLVKKF